MRRRFSLFAVSLFLSAAVVSADEAPLRPLSLRVRDSADGGPVAASIRWKGAGASAQQLGRSDAEGRGALELPEGEIDLVVEAPGHRSIPTRLPGRFAERLPVTVWLDPERAPAPLVPDLPEGIVAITGFVRDGGSLAPASGARVRLEAFGTSTTTDERGAFRLIVPVPALDPESVPPTDTLVVEVAGERRFERKELLLAPGSTRLLVDLPPAGEAPRSEFDGQRLVRIDRGESPELSPFSPSEPGPDVPPATVAQPESPRLGMSPTLLIVDPPNSIRVGTSCSCTTCSGVSVYSLETYVRQGLNDEWISSWPQHSLRAGSIAYRSYGSYYVLHPINASYDICSTTCCQVNDTDTATATNTATDATSGILLQRSNAVLRSEFSAENNAWDDPLDGLSCTNSDLSCGDGNAGSPAASWPCVSDSVCVTKGCFGHGRGECQWGTQRWASSPQLQLWAWITNHYYNAGGAGSGYRTAYMTSPISISSISPSPATVNPGGSFTINVAATNAAEVAHSQVMIGASLYNASAGYVSDTANDTKVTLASGANNVSRPFAVPAGTPAGLYDLIVALWLDVDGDGVITSADLSLTSTTSSGAVTVSSAAGTCANPIVISAFPYSDSSTTTGKTAAMDGYSCPPASGSEAGPEVVYRFTLTVAGKVTATVTDGTGVDIDPHLLSACSPSACLARNDTTFTQALYPGTYFIVCDTWTSGTGTQYPGAYTLNVTFQPDDTVAPAPIQTVKWSATAGRWQWSAPTVDRLGGAETMGSYQVFRSTSPSTAGSLLGSTANAYYADGANPPAGTTWFYNVRGLDAAGNRDTPALDGIVDNVGAAFAGSWSTGNTTAGYYGTDYRFVSTGGTGTNTATWSFTCEESGLWDVKTMYPAGANRSTAARFTISRAGGSDLVTWNQQANGGSWNTLGSVWLVAGATYTVVLDDAENAGFVVIADALRWTKR